jgi:hypothetical protein
MLKQWKHQRQLKASSDNKGLLLRTSHTLAEQLLEAGSFFTTAGILTAAKKLLLRYPRKKMLLSYSYSSPYTRSITENTVSTEQYNTIYNF